MLQRARVVTTDETLVLHAVASGGMYGIERMLSTLLPSLAAAGRSVALLSLGARDGESGALGRCLERKGIRVIYLGLRRNVHPGDLVALWKTLRYIRPSMVHLHGYKATISVGFIARLLRIPIAATVHSEAASVPELQRVIAVEGFALRRCDHIVAVSTGVVEDGVRRGVARTRITIIRNGIDDPGPPLASEMNSSRTVRAVVVGRLYEPKNVHVAIRAIELLASRGVRCNLEVIGDGPELTNLQRLATDRGVESQVEFLGFVDDVGEHLRHASLFLMPSRSEGIPLALLEAMAMRLPIVASRVGGIPELVSDEVHALLVAPDSPDHLAFAIGRLMVDPPLANRLAGAARERYKREFQTESMRRNYEEFYSRIEG